MLEERDDKPDAGTGGDEQADSAETKMNGRFTTTDVGAGPLDGVVIRMRAQVWCQQSNRLAIGHVLPVRGGRKLLQTRVPSVFWEYLEYGKWELVVIDGQGQRISGVGLSFGL